eukprot:10715829-Heterocapsa_arctica.AAC.1
MQPRRSALLLLLFEAPTLTVMCDFLYCSRLAMADNHASTPMRSIAGMDLWPPPGREISRNERQKAHSPAQLASYRIPQRSRHFISSLNKQIDRRKREQNFSS